MDQNQTAKMESMKKQIQIKKTGRGSSEEYFISGIHSCIIRLYGYSG